MSSGISFWRVAGLSYTQYVSVASNALRRCVKDEVLAKSKLKHDVVMRERVFVAGAPQDKTNIVDMFTPSPLLKAPTSA